VLLSDGKRAAIYTTKNKRYINLKTKNKKQRKQTAKSEKEKSLFYWKHFFEAWKIKKCLCALERLNSGLNNHPEQDYAPT
jgi:hypothetical protein